MPLQMLAMMAPGLMQSGFGLAGLLRKRKKFEGTRRGRMLGRQAGEGLLSPQEEREIRNRLLQTLLRTASEETEEIKRVAFPVLEKSKLAGARLLSAPYRAVRGRMTEAELRLQAGERRAAKEAGERFGMEEEQFSAREDAGRAASAQQLAGGLASLPGAITKEMAIRKLEGMSLDDMRKDPGELLGTMQRLGMRLPYGFSSLLRKPESPEMPFRMPKPTGTGSASEALEFFRAAGLPASLWEAFEATYWDMVPERE